MGQPGAEQDEESPVEVRMSFVTSKEHRRAFSNRVWGGWRGSTLEMNFLTETASLPESTVLVQNEEGNLAEDKNQRTGERNVRINEATIYMQAGDIVSFYNWLGEKIEELNLPEEVKGKIKSVQ